MNLGTKIMGGCVGVTVALIGVGFYADHELEQACTSTAKPESYNIRKQPIDQLFRDHDGYRLYFHDEDGKVHEEQFRSAWRFSIPIIHEEKEFKSLDDKEPFLIFKDLPEGEAPYAKILTYQMPECNHSGYHVEVHLPANQGLSPGLDSWISGKIPQYEPMKEIK